MKTLSPLTAIWLGLLLTACASTAPVAPAMTSDHNNLDATVWMQTSAEYRAAVLGGFALARQQLDAALADACWDALPAGERDNDPCGLPPAIITDADETLIDNSPFQARKIRDGQPFVYQNWETWVNERAARALPGALEFARYAASRGVIIYYVTNRDAPSELDATADNLRELGFPVATDGSNLMLRGDPRAPARSKGERRRWVGQRHRVALMLGDNLGDFIDGIDTDIPSRANLVDQHGQRWGTQWLMFPNPGYGSWESAVMRDCQAGEPTACKRA
ncbi:MAG: acid phosphatase, partial [Gammaproteobacteria bacterium HGW-Gammaproteobacteria-7]